MSVLGDVFGSLKSMSQVQLLLAFIACIGYAFAQGNLLPSRGRRIAWIAAALSAAGFAFVSADWTHATMLLGFAVAGMGSFVAMVWLTSRALGFGRTAVSADAAPVESGFGVTASASQQRGARATEHAHSL
jgi:hypothetical protein